MKYYTNNIPSSRQHLASIRPINAPLSSAHILLGLVNNYFYKCNYNYGLSSSLLLRDWTFYIILFLTPIVLIILIRVDWARLWLKKKKKISFIISISFGWTSHLILKFSQVLLCGILFDFQLLLKRRFIFFNQILLLWMKCKLSDNN